MELLVTNVELIEGLFVKELKNRFLCQVIINGVIEECYVPSSMKLAKYIKLKNKKVFLTLNKNPNSRTKYSIFAVLYYNKPILVNLNYANKLVEEMLLKQKHLFETNDSIYREKTIDGYKADFVISGTCTHIFEVKSVLGCRRNVIFPNVYSTRAIGQLKKILELIDKGHIVYYYIVSLSSVVKEIKINNNLKEFYSLFLQCIEKGMKVNGFSMKYKNGELYINNKISLIL